MISHVRDKYPNPGFAFLINNFRINPTSMRSSNVSKQTSSGEKGYCWEISNVARSIATLDLLTKMISIANVFDREALHGEILALYRRFSIASSVAVFSTRVICKSSLLNS